MAKEVQGKKFSKNIIIIGAVVVALIAGAGGMYLYNQQTKSSETELATLQKKLSSVIELPKEPPTLATVSDISKLQGQTFFENAQNGDKVLIYPAARKAILYRPSNNKIIEVGPINIANDQTTQTATQNASNSGSMQPVPISATPAPTNDSKVRVAVYNGTNTSGLARRAADQLQQLSSLQVNVVKRADAAKKDYADSIVVDLSGKKAIATQLANGFKAKVVSMPAGETKPDADILIILGSSYSK